jgi:hydrogenase maturation protease
VAGLGNAWLRDDGFGGAVVRALERDGVPSGVTVMDAGTSGLDLAYEVMRGYDALVLVDAAPLGGTPGTLYVLEPEEEGTDAPIEDGEQLDPHGMDAGTVLRFVRAVGGWHGRVLVVGCEPGEVEEVGLALTPAVEAAVGPAVGLVTRTVEELRTGAASG